MAVQLDTGVPWMMCKQTDAPDLWNEFRENSISICHNKLYDQAPLDEYGFKRQPKWGHLKDLHAAISLCSTTLLQGLQTNFSLGQLQEAYVFEEETRGCVAFLVNNDGRENATVNTVSNERTTTTSETFNGTDRWEEYRDDIPNFLDTSLKSNTLLEHMNTTKDKSDYLWYTFSFQHNLSCTEPVLHVESLGHVAHAFVNSTYAGAAHGNHDVKGFTMDVPIVLNDGMNNISILSVMVGLPDSGAFLERRFAGLTKVEIHCGEIVLYNFTNYEWGYQVGLLGEKLQIYTEKTWEMLIGTVFDAPVGDDPIALELGTMGKGEAWVNGQSIGRFWVSFQTSDGNSSQTLYNVPRSFIKPYGNLLVILEEFKGDPVQISLDTISVTNLHEPISHYHTI
ncbi:hypothetical protein JRO89_XS08G0256400 [Xanthoceras sorbifolium]|uniref:Beta-galactosidase galactose-binding domain-containing protein n=1 Tax=Xanthoceras sorbifolium TaxID=99658 RepID=A0ABQ8HRM7_9ROSI|nr:hypothetical protein JRO89_XS08G0256400 [Xanthoceras sorbifolium]